MITAKSETFNVTGEGTATVKPDIAIINAGVTSQGPTVKAAQDQLNTSINKVSEAIKKLGIEGKDIQTTNYNINPDIDFQSGTQRITGYNASTNLTIKVRKIDLANEVIDAATANGANQVGGIRFDVDDKSKVQDEARKKAVESAKRKAENAAKIAGFSLGRLVNYSEGFNGGPRPLPVGLNAVESAAKVSDTSIQPGSSEIKVTVTLSYEIR